MTFISLLMFMLVLFSVMQGTAILCIMLCAFIGPKASKPSNTWDTLNAVHDAMKACLKTQHTKEIP